MNACRAASTSPSRRYPTATWQLEVTADHGGYLVESDETDNVATLPVSLTHPDLTLSELSTTGTLQGGETITLHWTTHNTGSAEARNVRDAVYLSLDGTVDATDRKLAKSCTTPLPPAIISPPS